jgi:hypothetical protein
MTIDHLNDHEIGMLVVALKYWRAHRCDTATRHSDPILTNDAVSLLLAKLDSASLVPPRRRSTPGAAAQRVHRGH